MLHVGELNLQSTNICNKQILFVSDIHMIVDTNDTNPNVSEYQSMRKADFDKEDLVSGKEYFEEFIAFADANELDGIIFGGDIIDCPSEENLSFLKCALNGLKIPYFFAVGNHDWNFSWDYLSKKSYEKNVPLVENAVDRNLSIAVDTLGDIQIVTLGDSNYDIANDVLGLIKNLDHAKKSLFVMHVPYTTDKVHELALEKWGAGVTLGDGRVPLNDNMKLFMGEICKFEDATLLCGHVHKGVDERLIQGIRQIVAPAGCHGEAYILKL